MTRYAAPAAGVSITIAITVSTNWLLAAGCMGKERFPNGARAHRHAELLTTRGRNRRRRTKASVYRCTHCGGWHIGGMGPSLK